MGRNRFLRPRNQSKLCYEKIPEVCYSGHAQRLAPEDMDGLKKEEQTCQIVLASVYREIIFVTERSIECLK